VTLRDLIFQQPQYLLGGCVAWLIIAAWIVSLLHWMVMTEVDVLTGVFGIGLCLGLGYSIIQPPVPMLRPLSAAAIFLSGVMFPIIRAAFHRRELRDADVEGVLKGYEGLVFRPNNPTAQIRLAKHLYRLGVRGHAMALAEVALQNLPVQYFRDDHRMVEQWRTRPPRPEEFAPIPCAECQHPCPAGTAHCAACGSRFLLDRVRGRVLSSALGRRLLGAWISMVVALGGIPLATRLSGTLAVVVVVALVVAAVGALVLAFRPARETTA